MPYQPSGTGGVLVGHGGRRVVDARYFRTIFLISPGVPAISIAPRAAPIPADLAISAQGIAPSLSGPPDTASVDVLAASGADDGANEKGTR